MASSVPPIQPDRKASSIDRRWALAGVAVVVLLVVGAIGVYAFLPRSSNTPGASGSPGDQSAYAQLFAQVGPNGEVTKDMALEAFSLAIARLPGVTVPTAAPPTDYERMDGTFAIEWIWPYLGQLTPDQKAAVDAALKPDPNAPLITPGTSATIFGPLDNLYAFAQDTYYSEVKSAVGQIAGHLGRSLHVPWSVTVNSQQIDGATTLAYDAPIRDAFDNLSGCDIHINPALSQANNTALDIASMAHEIFHCFQFDYYQQHGGFGNLPPSWITEGQAEWAGENIGGPSTQGGDWWAVYFQTISRQLFSRTYDAVGFYAHLAEEGIDPWHVFDAMLGSATSLDAFTATGATADNFLDTWSSGEFRELPNGLAWFATGPWQVTAKAPSQDVTLGIGDDVHVATDPLFNHDVTVQSLADLVEVRMDGHNRIHTDPDGDELSTAQRWFCTEATGCKCPPGKSYTGPEFEVVSPTIEIGMTGALAGASGIIVGHSIDDYCKAQPTPEPQQPCQSDCGHSNGDPHLRTTNRYVYDFQAAGEFTLLRNADSSIDIQVRQEPYSSPRFPGVSTNTAVAARDNGHTVGVYFVGDSLALHVDGQQVDATAAPDLGSGAFVHQVKNGFEIGFPDGSKLDALSVGTWGINAIVEASSSLLGQGVGLIGPITPGNMGVPALPDGSQLPAAPDTTTREAILYSTFADAWRVTEASSLFDYDPGKTTESYTDRNFPSDADRMALDAAIASPDPAQQQAAQSACAGITDSDLQTDCEFDVFATGDDGFAQSYGAVQDLYDGGVVTPTGPPSEAPATPGPVAGATKVTQLSHLQSAAIGPDNTVYASIDDATQAPQLIAFDPVTGAVKQQTQMRVETDIHFAEGSVWAAGEAKASDGSYCSVTRYDSSTLADQGDYSIPCSQGSGAPRLTSMGDSVWFVSNDGTALVPIDPATNAPGRSVPLGYSGGCCQSSQGAVFCSCGNSDMWRLTSTDSAFVDLGSYSTIFPAGTGFWTEQSGGASYVDGPGGPTTTLSFTDPQHEDGIVGGDPTGVYVQGEPPDTPLGRLASDGSPIVEIASAPVAGKDTIDETSYDYGAGGFPWFATAQGYVHLWEFKDPVDQKDALWVQWAPLP